MNQPLPTSVAASSRAQLAEWDAQDPLASWRNEFRLPEGVLYFNGNSLGPPPVRARTAVQRLIDQEWEQGLSRSWNAAGWFELPVTLGNKLSALLGAAPGQVVVTDSTSVNLFKVLAAALALRPGRKVIVSERENFPTDLYVAQGIGSFLQQGHELRLVDDPADLAAAVGDDTAVLMLTHVNYRSGAMLDMAGLTHKAHEHGALVIWDLAHSAGVVPVELDACNVDFAVGCTYKYLNGGPGAPAYAYVAKRLQSEARQPLAGWWGHSRPFAFDTAFEPAADVRGFLCGTQPMLALRSAEAGIEVTVEAGIAALRTKSEGLTSQFIALLDARCPELMAGLQTPRELSQRGSQVSLMHPHGHAILQALTARGVVGDYREPGLMRFGMAPLYIRYVDLWDAVEHIRAVLDDGSWASASPVEVGRHVT